ncbi:hypothetical protein B9Z55_022614 [Caenorhabditis nigoni]|uniref:Uncharacterized protein n=1 Tax=Caenorhabditis nigoni TaxID=1611254 RepID=A0A2G5SLF4_9PELO|nr:hypothetical protein B9Z55_022614 [Caenorhabditis nigoni]
MAYWYVRQPGYKYIRKPKYEPFEVEPLPYMATDEIQSLSGKENQMSLSKVKEKRYKFFESLGFEIPELVIDTKAPDISIVDVYIYKVDRNEYVCGPEFKILANTSSNKKFVLCSVLSENPELHCIGCKLYTVREDEEEVAAFPGVKLNVAHTTDGEEPAIIIQNEDREQVLNEMNRRARQFFNLPEDEVSYLTTGAHMKAESKSKEELLIEGNFTKFEVVGYVETELLKTFLDTHRNLKCITFHHGLSMHRGPCEYPPALNTVENIVVLNVWTHAWFYLENFKGKNLVLLDADFKAGPLNRFLKAWKAGELPNLESFFFTFKPWTQPVFLPTMFDGIPLHRHEYTADERPYEFNSGIASVFSHPFNFKPGGGGAPPFFDIYQKNNVRQASLRFDYLSFLMIVWPNIVVDENLEPEVVEEEEEVEDEDDSESDDSENLGADEDLSVTSRSPTPSPLGSPARSQEPNGVPMPIGSPIRPGTPIPTEFPEWRFQPTQFWGSSIPNGFNKPKETTVRVGIRIPSSTLFPAKHPGCPTVPKRPLFAIESPSSMKAASSANTRNGQPQFAGFSSSNESSAPDKFAKPVGIPVKVGLPISAGSFGCGPIVPKRRRIESPNSTETSTTAKSQTGLPQPVGFSSPNESTVPAGSLKTNGTTCTVESALPNTTSFTVGCAKPTKNLMAAVPQAPEQIAFPAKWKEAQALIAQVSLLTETPGTKLEDIKSQLAQVLSFMNCSLPDNSKKPNDDAIALEPPISAAVISNPVGSHQGQPQIATVASPIQSSVQNGSEQANGLANVVKSPNTTGNGTPAASSAKNGLSIGSLHQIESSSPAGSLKEATVDSPIHSSVSNGSEQVPMESVKEGSRKELSQESTAASPIPSSVPAVSPEKNEDFKRSLERLLARSVPDGSKKPNGGSVPLEPPISAGLQKALSEQANVASPIQSSVQNGSEQANGNAIAIGSPNTIGNENPAASSDQNELSMTVRSSTRTETSLPVGSSEERSRKELSQESTVASPIQSSVPAVSPEKNEDFKRSLERLLARSVPDGSKKPNGGSVALEPPISAGLRKALSEQVTVASPIQSSVQNGSKQADGLAIVVESPNATGNGSPAASSDKNGLSIGSPHQIETLSSAGSLEERSRKELSQESTVASPIQSSVPAVSPENNEDFKRLLEKVIEGVARSVPNGSKKPNGDSVALEPPISAGSGKKLYQQAIVASPIQSSVQNGSKHANGLAIVVESPVTAGNGSLAASADQNVLSIGLLRQTETLSPAGSLEDGSDKWNESPVAPGLLIPATKMSVSAGSRKRPAQQDTSGSAEPNKLPNLADATSTEPNKLTTTTGSKFPSFEAFSNAFVGHWNTIHSCLTRISSMVVFLPNGEPVQLGSLLPSESPSTVNCQPSPGSFTGPSAEASSASLPEPQPEKNESESNDVGMEDEDN